MNSTQGFYIEPSKSEQADYARYQRKLNRTVYCVSIGMEGGYMPNDVSYFATKYAAMDYMKSEAEFSRDNPYKVTGSARKGLYILDSGRSLNEYILLDTVPLKDLVMGSDDIEGSFADIVERLNNNPF